MGTTLAQSSRRPSMTMPWAGMSATAPVAQAANIVITAMANDSFSVQSLFGILYVDPAGITLSSPVSLVLNQSVSHKAIDV